MPNYVGPALSRLSDTLYRGLSDIGKSRLASEELGLQRAKLEEEKRRYEENAPIREFQRTQAKVGLEKEQKADEPFSVPAFAREASQADQAQAEMGGGLPKAYERLRWISTAVPKIAKALNAKYDPETGTLVRSDTGKPLTNRDFQDPATQQKLAGIVGILTNSDKYLQMESDTPEAKALIEERSKNPVKYYLNELKVKTDYLNQLGTFGIPKESLNELAGEIKTLKGTIEKYEMTPEEKAKYDKQMLLLEKQIKEADVSIAKAGREEKKTYVNLDTGEIRTVSKYESPTEKGRWVPYDVKMVTGEGLDTADKLQMNTIKSQINAYNKELVKLDNISREDKTQLVNEFIADRGYTDEFIEKNAKMIEGSAIQRARSYLESKIKEAKAELNAFKKGGILSTPTAGLTTGPQYGAAQPGGLEKEQVTPTGITQSGQGQIPENMKTPENAMKAVLNVQKYNPEDLEDAIAWFKTMFPNRVYDLENLLNQGAKQPGESVSPSSQLRALTAPIKQQLGRERSYGKGLGLSK